MEEKKTQKVIDDKDRHKPFGKTAWAPVDDVYILRHYPRTICSAADAIDTLKRYQALDFTPENQPLYIDLLLNMKLEKKVSRQLIAAYFAIQIYFPGFIMLLMLGICQSNFKIQRF